MSCLKRLNNLLAINKKFFKYILFTDFANTLDPKLEPLKSYCDFWVKLWCAFVLKFISLYLVCVFVSRNKNKNKNPPKNQLNCHNEIVYSF